MSATRAMCSTLQAEVAQDVAREIKVALTPEESDAVGRAPRPVNPEAYEAYLKGQSHWYWLSREHLDTALEYFELAREKDPSYALAYVGIANVWSVRGDAGFMPPSEAMPKAKAAISKALDARRHALRSAHHPRQYHGSLRPRLVRRRARVPTRHRTQSQQRRWPFHVRRLPDLDETRSRNGTRRFTARWNWIRSTHSSSVSTAGTSCTCNAMTRPSRNCARFWRRSRTFRRRTWGCGAPSTRRECMKKPWRKPEVLYGSARQRSRGRPDAWLCGRWLRPGHAPGGGGAGRAFPAEPRSGRAHRPLVCPRRRERSSHEMARRKPASSGKRP